MRHNGEDKGWRGQRGCKEGDTVGLLLDFNRGSLTVYLNDDRLSVMASGLSGPLCWMATLYTEAEAVRISGVDADRLTNLVDTDIALQEAEDAVWSELI